MNFYEYYTPDEVIDNPCLLAAQTLIEHGFEVVPLEAGTRGPVKHETTSNLARLRQTPIKVDTLPFYFAGNFNAEIAIMLRRNMEVLDVDDKACPGIAQYFIRQLEYARPGLYDKLVISKTPHNGLHIPYFSEITGGDPVLARVNASPWPLAIIERLNEVHKNYIKCSPSVGYDFIKGNPIEMPTLTGEERNWLSAFSASFNKVIIPEVKKVESERKDSPWTVFNEQHDYKYTLNELTERGWTVKMELTDHVRLMRPGGTQLSACLWKDTNSFYCFTTSSEFEPEKGYTPFGIYTHFYHDGNVALACRKLASEGIGVNINDEGQFWIRKKTKIIIKYTELSQWLFNLGYRIYENEIVKITGNIISLITDREIKAAFIRELEPEIVDEFYDKVSKIFSPDGGLMAMLQVLEDKFIYDTDKTTWIFFKNYAVKITAKEILPMQYKEAGGYVWHDAVIDRSFYNDAFAGADCERFVKILGGVYYDRLCKLIGYALSRYKDPINPRAIILTEDIEPNSDDESQGGSGKGLLFSFLRHFRKVADFDGKNFKIDNTFLYQNVDIDTNILFIDDVPPKFKFDNLFSIITGALLVNKKNKKQLIIPFDKAPKLFITSNHEIGTSDESSKRRRYGFPIVKYFGKDLQPVDEFGRQFFSEWDNKEFSKFDNFMAYCAQQYLFDTNHKDINYVSQNSAERSLINESNEVFISYMDSQLSQCFFDFAPDALKTYKGEINGIYYTNGVDYYTWKQNMDKTRPDKELFIVISKDVLFEKAVEKTKLKSLKLNTVTHWLKVWCESRNVEIDTRYQVTSGRANKVISFPNSFDVNPFIEVDLPF